MINLTEENFTSNRPDDPYVKYLKVDKIEFDIQTPIGSVADSKPWADITNKQKSRNFGHVIINIKRAHRDFLDTWF